jgi:hypothetical protein
LVDQGQPRQKPCIHQHHANTMQAHVHCVTASHLPCTALPQQHSTSRRLGGAWCNSNLETSVLCSWNPSPCVQPPPGGGAGNHSSSFNP